MKKKTRRRQPSVPLEQTEAKIENAIDQFQEAWEEEIFSDEPSWGIVLGIHLRLCELEHLVEAGEELML